MTYQISENLITMNRPRIVLIPQGTVLHSTANPGATAKDHFNYFNNKYRGSSPNYTLDWIEIMRFIPESEQAWHAGPTANGKYLGIEMCEPKGYDPDKFLEVWLRAIWLVSDLCKRYNWTTDQIFDHATISNIYRETDHQDPTAFLKQYGKTMADFKKAVVVAVSTVKPTVQAVARPTIYRGKADYATTLILQTKLNGMGYSLVADGDFGLKTEAAVRRFQQNNGLDADGIVGPLTWAKIG